MDKMLSMLRRANPAYGVKEVEFSSTEVKSFRDTILEARKTGQAVKADSML
jgi:hypothetical protein